MVYQHAMFTHRICCCTATTASQVMACIALVISILAAVGTWVVPDEDIYISIYQTVLVAIEICACCLVFFAVCNLRPDFVIPIIVIQILNSISIIGLAIWFLWVEWWALTAFGVAYYICLYAISECVSLFVLHCHVCCYKVLLFKMHTHAHHCPPTTAHYAV
ncbi:hypothetical protein PRIPAC_80646 [Pristionchus pacificus]|uniref:Uncharacterized protein n=1 Tax=Pristionchus pacificus TaxID=54126 RepID=A0A2A6CLQ9_PRIPA|nr:hypothetical protein PRIPAC_80646 [Pristionchus pacificus]|eukprot:PDM79144.1 hypothetical protein PRIPAC_31723 [Pristionchus pacificus]